MASKLEEILEKARAEVASDRRSELPFATRKELLRELGPVLPANEQRGPGLIRRTRLCLAVVRQVLPSWEALYPNASKP